MITHMRSMPLTHADAVFSYLMLDNCANALIPSRRLHPPRLIESGSQKLQSFQRERTLAAQFQNPFLSICSNFFCEADYSKLPPHSPSCVVFRASNHVQNASPGHGTRFDGCRVHVFDFSPCLLVCVCTCAKRVHPSTHTVLRCKVRRTH